MRGALIAFEGIDQAGKLTQARNLAKRLADAGTACELWHYPDYATPIGRILEQALNEGLALDARARTMLFAANRWEKDAMVRDHVSSGGVALIDRYSASNVVYGLSQGYDRSWLESLESGLLPADVTVLVEISPEESARRKQSGRDDFERNARLLQEAQRYYTLLAQEHGWLVVDGALSPDEVGARILAGLRDRLGAQIAALASL